MTTALDKLFAGLLLAKEADGVRESTLETYRVMYRDLTAHLPVECLVDAASIQPEHLQSWVVDLRSRLAPATCDQRIAKAKAFFGWAHAQGFLPTNPAIELKRPRKTWQPDPLTEDETIRLLDEAKRTRAGVRNHAILCVLFDSGMRNSELRRLEVGDVSLKTGQIRIREAKGGKARTVLVGSRTREALWRWMMQRPDDAATLFCTETGQPLSRIRLRVIVSAIGKRAGIRAYPHRLRHTFALQYLKLRGDPYSLQYLLGHEDMGMTRQYVKIAEKDASEMYRSPLDALES